ncbi:MAG TPA: hypothetical protein VLJ37_06840 [bacterium]|nr:hypothetical protein [bacterium]
MIRFLIFLGLLYVLYLVITRPMNDLFGKNPRFKFRKPKPEPKRPRLEAEEMAACELCGTFISRREGEIRDGKFVCKPHCH